MVDEKEDLDYLFVLKALKELPFNCGRKLLKDFLMGKEENSSISRNKLYKLENFGSMAYMDDELNKMIDNLILNGLIHLISMEGNRFAKLLELTAKGNEEIVNPTLYKKKLSYNFSESKTLISDKDKEFFNEFEEFLERFNDEQKKAIVCNNDKILCIAGAGSGKTSSLIKRIEFLIKYRSVSPEKIMAITFTRKARQEMISRLSKISCTQDVSVETFNSFCEKILRKFNDLIYGQSVKLITYSDKITIVQKALENIDINSYQAINLYFDKNQRRGKTNEELFRILLNDCFFVKDYFNFKNKPLKEIVLNAEIKNKKVIEMIFEICNYIDKYMKDNGLRDFADQLIDTINFFKKENNLIPNFEHILIDEYQDINSTQIKLIELLNSRNLFCVGDPRQSIYGWRGSDIKYILNFDEKYPNSEIINLTKNYRSTKYIVKFINSAIKEMNFKDLEPMIEGDKEIELNNFPSEDLEFMYIAQTILTSSTPKKEIFVLARTNNKLKDLSEKLTLLNIPHAIKNETNENEDIFEDKVTLATAHSIKGLEADMVFLMGCTKNNFPCIGSEHPVIEMIKVEEYDKEEEEKRLFYVAMSRAKKSLYLTYQGKNPTYFITDEMYSLLGKENLNSRISNARKEIETQENLPLTGEINNSVLDMLKGWRRISSQKENVPAYCILNDRTLKELAIKIPENIHELENIHGIGSSKIEKYGKDILKIVNYKG
ncbi:hypothetical protein CXT76_02515 [Candidatus Parvarchaeota archaeon]|jgi:superfamily I DNA/RNA helicase|nr:MAG: hypothetical protein CXT76_02515 [Candidatus Parvarchaeota archaeon]